MATLTIPKVPVSLLKTDEVAALLRVSQDTVRQLVRARKLQAVRIGRVLRFHPNAIDLLAGEPAGPRKIQAKAR